MPGDLERAGAAVNPLMGSLLGRMQYYWVTAQCEYSTHVMFKSEAALKELYPKLISHSALCFGAKEIIGFLGKKLAGTFRGEYVSDLSDLCNRPEPLPACGHEDQAPSQSELDQDARQGRFSAAGGDRDHDPTAFKVRKHVRRRRRRVTQWVEMRKGVANLFRYRDMSLTANRRYLEALTASMIRRRRYAIWIRSRSVSAPEPVNRSQRSIRWLERIGGSSRRCRAVSITFAASPITIYARSSWKVRC